MDLTTRTPTTPKDDAPGARAVKERPIIFGAESVRAILEGRKTQTRRVVKFPERLRPEGTDWIKAAHEDGGGNWVFWSTDAPGYAEFTKRAYPNGEGIPCPYGKVGERLWMREACAPWFNRRPTKIDWRIATDEEKRTGKNVWRIHYKATPTYAREQYDYLSPIHMPRWASRLTLEITKVRVERLQDITETDAAAEGCTATQLHLDISADEHESAREQYARVWDELNAKRGFSFESNPWVWVIDFKRIDPARATT